MSNTPPAQSVRRGSIQVAIWRNQGQFGPLYKCKITRSYQDDAGAWRHTAYINGDQILALKAALDDSDHWIQSDRKLFRQYGSALGSSSDQDSVAAQATDNLSVGHEQGETQSDVGNDSEQVAEATDVSERSDTARPDEQESQEDDYV